MAHSGKTMTFKVDLLPDNTADEYSLGNAQQKWKLNGGTPALTSDLADYVLRSELDGLGAGDMLKSTYDTNNDGIVDAAATLGDKTAGDFVLKAGDTMTGALELATTAGNGAEVIKFGQTAGSTEFAICKVDSDAMGRTIGFRQYRPSGTYRENYYLPGTTDDLTASVNYDILTTKSTITVAQGGTGATTLTSGAALIGNGTGAVTTRAIRNSTSVGHIGWTSSTASNALLTQNDIAYWNGRYNASASNLQYCKLGEFGSMAVASADDYLPLAGGTMTGQIVLASSGYKTSSTAGYSADQYGVLKHQRTTTTDSFQIQSNAGTTTFRAYWESGNVTMAGQLTITANSGFIVKGTGSARVYGYLRSDGDYQADFAFGREGANKWSFSCRTSSDAYFGLYNHSTSHWVYKVTDADQTTFNYAVDVGGILKVTSNKDLRMVDNAITQGTTPSSNHYGGGLHLCDSANTDLGYVRQLYLTNGGSGVQMEAWRKVSDANKYSTLNLYVASDGTAIANSNSNWTFSGGITVSGTSKFNFSGIEAASGDSARPVWFAYDGRTGTPVYNTNFTYNPSTKVLTVGSVTGNLTGNVTGNCSGSAGSVAWGNVTSRPSNAGSSTQPVYWSSNAAVAVTQPASGAWFSSVPMINSNGVMEVGRYIDFHNSNTGTSDYDVRMNCTGSGKLTITGTVSSTFSGNLTGDVTGTASGNLPIWNSQANWMLGASETTTDYPNVTLRRAGGSGVWALNLVVATSSSTSNFYELISKTGTRSFAMLSDLNGYVAKTGDTMTGPLYINYTTDTSGTNDTGGLIVGNKAGENIAIDSNELFARNNKAASTLYIQTDGGSVVFGNATAITATIKGSLSVTNGVTFSNKSFNYSGIETATSNALRGVWFSDVDVAGKPCINTGSFTHNPYSGAVEIKNTTTGNDVVLKVINTGKGNLATYLDTANSGNHGVYSNGYWNGSEFVSGGKWLVYRNTSNVITVNGNCTGTSANVTGTVAVANGGTGATTFTSGRALIGAGTNAVTTRAITNNTATTSALTANTNLVTANTVKNYVAWSTNTDWATVVTNAKAGIGEIMIVYSKTISNQNRQFIIRIPYAELTTSGKLFYSEPVLTVVASNILYVRYITANAATNTVALAEHLLVQTGSQYSEGDETTITATYYYR